MKVQDVEKLKTEIYSYDAFAQLRSVQQPASLSQGDMWAINFATIKAAALTDETLSYLKSTSGLAEISEVAIMKGDENVVMKDAQFFTFHRPHIDSKPVEKVLIVLEGSGEYDVFTKSDGNYTTFENVELRVRQFLLKNFDFILKRMSGLRNVISHKLSSNLLKKGTSDIVYKDEPGAIITFNNFEPHWSHPYPMKDSMLLQIVAK